MLTTETYKAVYDSYPDAVILVDYFGIIVLANSRADDMFGYSRGELLGYSVETLMPAAHSKTHQKHRSDYLNGPKMPSKSGRVLPAIRKDGTRFTTEISLSPIKIGKKNFVAAFVKDVTIRQSLEVRFQKMVSEVQDYAILFMDIHGNITHSNKGVQHILGYPDTEIVGNHFQMLYSESDLAEEAPEKHLDKAIEDGSVEIEGWRSRKDGRLIWASIVITTIKDDGGVLIGFSKVIRDLTHKKKAEELLKKKSDALQAKNKELESFAYIASHDLQEPLSTITGMIELIRHDSNFKPDEETDTYFTFIESAIERMRALIKAFLEYSMLGRNKQLKVVNVAEVINEVKADLGTRIQSQNASIEVGSMPQLMVYSVEFRLLIQNLVGNALKFVKQGTKPVVKIDAVEYNNYWKFSVQDNGIGIEKNHQEKIFIIFQRLNKQSQFPGSGIGLAHCKKIVEIHEGSIWLNSEMGVGTTFYFTIAKNLKPADETAIV